MSHQDIETERDGATVAESPIKTDRKLGIVELLKLSGEENVKVQFLASCMGSINDTKKHGTKIEFYTDAICTNDVFSKEPRAIGMVLWIDRAAYVKACDDFNASNA